MFLTLLNPSNAYGSVNTILSNGLLSSTGTLTQLSTTGDLNVFLDACLLASQAQVGTPEKAIYQEIWIIEEKKRKKKAKKRLKKKLEIAFEALELAQERQVAEPNWRLREQAIELAQTKLKVAQASLALFDAETALQEAIYQQKTFDETQALLRLEFERLAEIRRQEEERRVAEENEELMMLMAYMLQLD